MLINKLKNLFFKEKFNEKQINNIVENIIKISGSKIFYDQYKIPKNFLSRFEIIVVFVFLLHNRLKNERNCKIKLQKVYDCLFDYIDISLRQIGVGDLSVGKKIAILAKKFTFRIKTYEKSFENDFNDIKKPIKKYIYNNNTSQSLVINKFVKYILSENKKLKMVLIKKIFVKNYFKLPKKI